MKIMTILGTRPEIIRLSLVIKMLDQRAEHVLVHTGQNYDDRLNGLFFREMGIRKPDVFMDVRGSGFAGQVGEILAKSESLFLEHRPDRLLILGDTNSGLTAMVARRLGIPVYHMEAGNRCYDDRVPEEVNRRVIDHSSSVLMPYTNRSRENLLREGIAGDRIYVTGNPIKEVIDHYADRVALGRQDCSESNGHPFGGEGPLACTDPMDGPQVPGHHRSRAYLCGLAMARMEASAGPFPPRCRRPRSSRARAASP